MSDERDLVPTPRPMPRGLVPSPRSRAFAAVSHAPSPVPASFAVIPPRLSYWGNDVDGDCVSAEEAFAKACYAVQLGNPETFIPAADLTSWAARHGFMNGASCTEVMDAMLREGLTSGGVIYRDGPYQSVDWTDDAVLSSAIYQGPVKIAVAADQLERAATPGRNGWIATGFRPDRALDHCVSLCGFGPLGVLATAFGPATLPPGITPIARAYLLFTWNSIGVIDRDSLVAITGEAWLRTPTTPGVVPVPPPEPTPTPPPDPAPAPPPQPGPPPTRQPVAIPGNKRGWDLYLWRPADVRPSGAGPHPAEVVLSDGSTVLLSAIGR